MQHNVMNSTGDAWLRLERIRKSLKDYRSQLALLFFLLLCSSAAATVLLQMMLRSLSSNDRRGREVRERLAEQGCVEALATLLSLSTNRIQELTVQLAEQARASRASTRALSFAYV